MTIITVITINCSFPNEELFIILLIFQNLFFTKFKTKLSKIVTVIITFSIQNLKKKIKGEEKMNCCFSFKEIAFVNTPTPFSTSSEYNMKINIARIHCIKGFEYEDIQSIYDHIDSVVY